MGDTVDLPTAQAPRLIVTEPDGAFTVELTGDKMTLGRNSDSDIWIRSGFISKRHAVLERSGDTYKYIQIGETNPTFLKGAPIVERLLRDRDSLRIGPEDGPNTTLLYVNPDASQQVASVTSAGGAQPPKQTSLMVRGSLGSRESLTIGRGPMNDLVLASMLVSRRHAIVANRDGRYFLKDANSSNGTFVNGAKIDEERLEDGDSIRIGPYRLLFEAGELHGYNEEKAVRLDAYHITKTIGPINILSDVSLSVLPGELVAIVGTSGSGKSTFMDALNGVRPATTGTVLVNGVDLYREFDAVRPLIGYVPQFSTLHDELPLERALYYTGRLRFADDVGDDEVRAKVTEVMRTLQIEQRAKVPVGRLSGGQQKRASLAAELLTEPGLLFLDEPTTGLDAGLTRKLVEKFRDLANEGRTVVLVTHDTESLQLCDLIIFLTAGKTIYLGPPKEAASFFQAHDIGEVYGRVEEEEAIDILKEKCLDSTSYEKYLRQRQAGASQGRPDHQAVDAVTPGSGNVGLSGWRQFLLLVRRYTELILRDPRTLALLLIQAPFLALLLDLISERNGFQFATGFDAPSFNTLPPDVKKLVVPSLPLLMAASVTWFGAINAAREIVKEVPVFRRERLAGLKALPYLLSKVVVLGVLCVVQASLFFLLIDLFKDIPSRGILGSGHVDVYLTLVLTCFASLGLGLLISALSPNPDRAQSLVPLILIPQLIFARIPEGSFVLVNVLAYSSISRWAFEAMGTIGRVEGGSFQQGDAYVIWHWAGLGAIAVALIAFTGVLLWRRRLA